jgi:error-prone DNA polymerase
LRYEYPEELAPPGRTAIEYLCELTWTGLARRYPQGTSAKVRSQVEHELQLIEDLRYEAYF